MYLVLFLRLSPLQFGVVDGLYQGVGGAGAGRLRLRGRPLARHKEVAFLGYALSAVCKLGLLAAGSAWGLLGRGRHRRPHRQGHPHRAARRADLPQHAAVDSSARRSASTARSTRWAR